jgi:Trk-type K+ transport system membrane component
MLLFISFEIIFSFLIASSSGLILLYYYYHNKNRRIERYLLKHKKCLFTLLQLAYFILIVSVVFNIRYIISTWLEEFNKSLLKSFSK